MSRNRHLLSGAQESAQRRPPHPSEASVGEDVDECLVRTGYVGGDLVDLLRFEQQLLSDTTWEAWVPPPGFAGTYRSGPRKDLTQDLERLHRRLECLHRHEGDNPVSSACPITEPLPPFRGLGGNMNPLRLSATAPSCPTSAREKSARTAKKACRMSVSGERPLGVSITPSVRAALRARANTAGLPMTRRSGQAEVPPKSHTQRTRGSSALGLEHRPRPGR
jgi:hypothetical protein